MIMENFEQQNTNVLRSTLDDYRGAFLTRCVASLFWVAGYTALFGVSWQIGVGVLLVNWAVTIQQSN